MSYIDRIKYRTIRDDPDQYFDNVKVVSLDIIHHECCGDKLISNYKDYKTIKKEDLNCHPKGEAEVVLSAAFFRLRWMLLTLLNTHASVTGAIVHATKNLNLLLSLLRQ